MTDLEIEQLRAELLRQYPGATIVVAGNRREVVAEIESKRAVAVIERSEPHFHRRTTEVYRVLRGTLYVACGGNGHVLGPGDSLTIEPGRIHQARCGPDGFAWIEALSEPAWTPEDHHVL